MTGGCAPAVDAVARVGYGPERRRLARAIDGIVHGRKCFMFDDGQRILRFDMPADAARAVVPGAIYLEKVGESVLELISPDFAVLVRDGQRKLQPGIVAREGLGKVDRRALQRAGRKVVLQGRAGVPAVERITRGIALVERKDAPHLHILVMAAQPDAQLSVQGFEHEPVLRHAAGPHRHVEGILAQPQIVVAEDSDAERVYGVRPDVEVRGVVLAQIDVVVKDLAAAHGADMQAGSIAGRVVGILLPGCCDRRAHALAVGKHVERSLRGGSVPVSRRKLPVEKDARAEPLDKGSVMARQAHRPHGADFDVGHRFVDLDVVVDPRDGAADLQRRQLHRPAPSRNRDLLHGGHHEVVELGTVGHREGLQHFGREVPHIRMGICYNVERIVARHALEVQVRRRGVDRMRAAGAEEQQVDVGDRILVRRAGDAVGILGRDADLDRDGFLRRTLRELFIDAAAQPAAEREECEYQKTGFHGFGI